MRVSVLLRRLQGEARPRIQKVGYMAVGFDVDPQGNVAIDPVHQAVALVYIGGLVAGFDHTWAPNCWLNRRRPNYFATDRYLHTKAALTFARLV